MTSFKIRLVRSIDELEAYKEHWIRLSSLDSRDGFFRSWEWQIGWFKQFGQPESLYTLIILDDTNNVRGIVALVRYKYRNLPFGCTSLGFMGRDVVTGDYLDILAADDDKAYILSFVINWFLEQNEKFTILTFGDVLRDSNSFSATQTIVQSKKPFIRFQEHQVCPYIELPESYDLYLKSLSKKFRSNVKYATRRAINKLNGQIVVNDDAAELNLALNDLFDLHVQRWKSKGVSCTFENENFREFTKNVCQQLALNKKVRLYRLFIEGKKLRPS